MAACFGAFSRFILFAVLFVCLVYPVYHYDHLVGEEGACWFVVVFFCM